MKKITFIIIFTTITCLTSYAANAVTSDPRANNGGENDSGGNGDDRYDDRYQDAANIAAQAANNIAKIDETSYIISAYQQADSMVDQFYLNLLDCCRTTNDCSFNADTGCACESDESQEEYEACMAD